MIAARPGSPRHAGQDVAERGAEDVAHVPEPILSLKQARHVLAVRAKQMQAQEQRSIGARGTLIRLVRCPSAGEPDGAQA